MIKKIVTILFFTLSFIFNGFGISDKLGDVNGNGIVDILDALAVAKYSIQMNPQPFYIDLADVNGDKKVDISDALLISNYSVGQGGDFRPANDTLEKFQSLDDLIKAFNDSKAQVYIPGTSTFIPPPGMYTTNGWTDKSFSGTNIQVEGVDEADIVKTDGTYIYTLSQGKLIIAKAYPISDAQVLSNVKLDNITPTELLIDGNRMVILGSRTYIMNPLSTPLPPPPGTATAVPTSTYYPVYGYGSAVKLVDISDKKQPKVIRTLEFNGTYLTSRKIGSYVYFIINSSPQYYDKNIIPLFRDIKSYDQPDSVNMIPVADSTEIGYIRPIQAFNFLILASISMANENEPINRQVVVGRGQTVYASLTNMYIAQDNWPKYSTMGLLPTNFNPNTSVTKFSLSNGSIQYAGHAEVPGHTLNQYSMDEFNDNFRIATTIGDVFNTANPSTNNVYVLSPKLLPLGKLENLAPGEKIYSARFMGKKGYLVTFKKVDPLFVLDLADPVNPAVLGKLKIPGFSDYLHPYDENHIIGIGKDAVDATSSQGLNFAWYQGLKMAIFDVTDVNNPVELYTELIGDRGTTSEVLTNPKAFLFDKDRNLLVLPILLAEIKGEKISDSQMGEFTYQGAYVYNISLTKGFDLRGKISHYNLSPTDKFVNDSKSNITRSLFIDDVLYTLSQKRLQLNDMQSLAEIKRLDF